jgi:hypothetical protein
VRLLSNAALSTLHGLHNLAVVPGQLAIQGNPALHDLTGLESLSELGGSLLVSRALPPMTLPQGGCPSRMHSEQPLRAAPGGDIAVALSSVKQNKRWAPLRPRRVCVLQVVGNAALVSLNGLSHLPLLRAVGRNLMIEDNPNLGDLEGLEGLTSVGHSLVVRNNTALTDLFGLHRLLSVGELGQVQVGGLPL